MKEILTERLVLRRFEEKDAKDMHALFCDEEAMRYTGMYPPFERMEQTEERIGRWKGNDRRLAIVLKETGTVIGYVGINPDSEEDREDTRELGFAIRCDYRQQGYMREAVSAVLPYLRDEGIVYVWACCFKGNDASEALIRALGFEFQQEGSYDAENDRTYESLEFRMTL